MSRTWLTEARKRANLTPTQVAFHLEVSERAVSSWEKGIRTPSREHQLALAKVLKDEAIPGRFDAELAAQSDSRHARSMGSLTGMLGVA